MEAMGSCRLWTWTQCSTDGGLRMKNDLNEALKFVRDHFEEMEDIDKLRFLLALEEFGETVEVLKGKYDVSGGFRIEYRRLDE